MLQQLEEYSSLTDILIKVGMFILVQVLVYLILANSSDIFSKNKVMRSLSFKPARSVSIRRVLAAVSDIPSGGEPSPRPTSSSESYVQDDPIFDDCDRSPST